MALRPLGVYMLTSTALYARKKTVYHVGKMTQLAGESASLATLAGEELEASIEMGDKAAIQSEQGLELQSTSIELEVDAEEKIAKAAGEMILAKEYSQQAEILHEQAAAEMSESDIAAARAREDFVTSEALLAQAEEDRAAELLDEESSAAAFEKATTAEEIATEAEERAAEYEAIVVKNEGQSLTDSASLAKTEVGAVENAETVAACTPIPFLNFFCEAFGAISETALQGRAAFEGAKTALESLAAASAQRKENAELALALEKHEEAARFADEGKEYQTLAEAKRTTASEEFAEADRLKVDMEESEYLAQTKKDEALNDEALAALDEDKAAEYYANSARDEAIASEEEASSVIAQSQADEFLESSTGEVFSASEMRLDAETKEATAEQQMKRSLAHGLHAFGFALQSLITAGLVIYVVVMRNLFHTTLPAVKRSLTSESQLTWMDFGQNMMQIAMHFTVLIGTISGLVGRRSCEGIEMSSKWKALILLATTAGLIESAAIHSLTEACYCYLDGKDTITTSKAITVSFLSNAIYLIPVALMECLILLVVFGPTVFVQIHNTIHGGYQVLLWVGLILMFSIISILKLKRMSSVAKPGRTPKHKNEIENGVEEGYFCGDDKRTSLSALNSNKLEYGTMEEISLLDSPTKSVVSDEKEKGTGFCQKFCQYWKSLQSYADLLLCSLMAMLFYHSWPLLKVLQPISEKFLGVAASLHTSLLLLAVIGLIVTAHFMFVR